MSEKSGRGQMLDWRELQRRARTPEELDRSRKVFEGLLNGSVVLADLLEVSQEQIDLFLQHAIQQFRSQKLEEARETLEMILTLSPYHAEAWRTLGAVMQESGAFDEAVYAYNLALIHDPADAVALIYRGQALLRLERHEEGIESLTRGIEIGSKDEALEPWVQRGRVVLAAFLAKQPPKLAVVRAS